jgi:nitrogen fixation protein
MTDHIDSVPYMPQTALHGKPLAWVEVKSWKACYELRAGAQVAAIMEMDGAFKVTATAHSAQGSWHLARHGLFKMYSNVTPETQSEPILRLDNVWWDGGSIILPNGRKLLWRNMNFWGTKFAFVDAATEHTLITYNYRGFLKSNADVVLSPEAESLSDLTMLLSLGWYLVVRHMMDAAAASVMVSGVVAS